MKVEVSEECIGCGACVAIAPAIFELNTDTMKSHVKKQPEGDEEEKLARQAADSCPVSAISVK